MKVRIKRVDKSLPLPEYHTAGSVAFDMYCREDATLSPGEVRSLPSNLIIEVPGGYFLMVAARSSAPKKGINMANGIGVIDRDYHGPEDEICILAHNFTEQVVTIKRGDRIAQGLVLPIEKAEWEEIDKIKAGSRGGFGSTG